MHARRILVALATVLLVSTSAVLAQNAKTFATDSTNNDVVQVVFDPPGITVLNTDALSRASLRGLVVRNDGVDGVNLIVCDTGAGDVLFYQEESTVGETVSSSPAETAPPLPDGPSIDVDGNLFVISSGPGNEPEKRPQVWAFLRDSDCDDAAVPGCRFGGYRSSLGLLDDSFVVDGAPFPVSLLADSIVSLAAEGQPLAGDLLVLVNAPPTLLRYPADDIEAFLDALGSGNPSPAQVSPEVLIAPEAFPAASRPSGIAFSPNGDFLIATEGGKILIYEPDGTRKTDDHGNFVDFATGLGNGKLKIAVGLEDAEFRAYVADRNGGQILRFTILEDGTGQQDAEVTEGIRDPLGIDTTTSTNVELPAGANVAVNPTGVVESTFEEIVTTGTLNAELFLFTDIRESEVEGERGAEECLHRSLLLSEISSQFPDIEIPPCARAFRKNDPVSGPPTFILVQMDNDAGFNGIIDHFSEESIILGYEPDCDDPDFGLQPRMLWAPGPDEAPVVEGPVFVDYTVECGSDRAWSRDTSFFLAGARVTQTPDVNARSKLENLILAVDSYTCIERFTRRRLARKAEIALAKFEEGRISQSIAVLRGFISTVESTPGAFEDCTEVNVEGELRARPTSAIFDLEKLL